jgi:DNA-binding NarL/FixJ family response regulator
MKPVICFIDDSTFEHELVREQIATATREYEFVLAYTFEEAAERLGDRVPALFLLDLWGRDEAVSDPQISDREDLEQRVSRFPNLDQVYAGIEEFPGDRINEYLKRLFAIVDSWRSLFEEVCDRAGQNGKYGLSNLRQARERYPGVPAVFYTRKSLIRDAVDMFRAGADGLFIKPTGADDAHTRRLTREYAPRLIRELRGVVAAAADPARVSPFPLP